MDRPVIVRLVGLVSGHATPMDGQWLVDYDPTRPGFDPEGGRMLCHLVATANRATARRFANAAEALEFVHRADGIRPDGKPNRPITAFTLSVQPADPMAAWLVS